MSEKEKYSLYKETEHFIETWNQGNAKAAVSFCTEGGVRVGTMGEIPLGREEIEKDYDNLMRKKMT